MLISGRPILHNPKSSAEEKALEHEQDDDDDRQHQNGVTFLLTLRSGIEFGGNRMAKTHIAMSVSQPSRRRPRRRTRPTLRSRT